jgi:bacterioferritin-associated ferredoxin
LGTPAWLEPSTPPPVTPADTSPLPNAETPASAVPPAGASGLEAGAAEPRTLVEGMKVVCICKGIKKRVFWKALDDGAQTKEEVNRATGSGTGSCQGRRCGPRILDLLRSHGRR